jgi:hypothetical protein
MQITYVKNSVSYLFLKSSRYQIDGNTGRFIRILKNKCIEMSGELDLYTCNVESFTDKKLVDLLNLQKRSRIYLRYIPSLDGYEILKNVHNF